MKRFNSAWLMLIILFSLVFLLMGSAWAASTNATVSLKKPIHMVIPPSRPPITPAQRRAAKLRSLKAPARPKVTWTESVTTNAQNQITKIMTGTHADGTETKVCIIYNDMVVPFEYRQRILTAPEEERMNFAGVGPIYRTDMPGAGEVPKLSDQKVTDSGVTEETRMIDLRW